MAYYPIIQPMAHTYIYPKPIDELTSIAFSLSSKLNFKYAFPWK